MKDHKTNFWYVDEVSTDDMVKLFNEQDKTVAYAVEKTLGIVAAAVEMIVKKLRLGGRLFYLGSGTSGKISVLDATECPPTFGIDDGVIIGIISGGIPALYGWHEETEDTEEAAVQDLKSYNFSAADVLVAVSASGNTPYVLAAARFAGQLGATTIGLCCSPDGLLDTLTELCITIDVGPEVILGSTRLKAGTAQKMVLNMLSSGAMIRMGKVYKNLMVDVRPINNKLRQRVKDMVAATTGKKESLVTQALTDSAGNAKTAILMLTLDIDAATAQKLLEKHHGYLRQTIEDEQ
ncbi:N-acetylmuramic acid 6-phosphate etherase [Sporomusaceae bacterium BoRhaA]|uniref:N-acetylmuramic acid 6-phosphate etherase n=1 Tax=Pelorhabdus rhamnosifermentans TaxID=2772457 RepID=UPI0028B1D4F5|nr:N-acetylmuramic acid 6-phosphate etherase [Pelorhabdus rhamnosifermentans]MBU2703232.1 N-acetylmuramic acid 6-phosphate etherase [Pelorhabdus rhamnosifermentans]